MTSCSQSYVPMVVPGGILILDLVGDKLRMRLPGQRIDP